MYRKFSKAAYNVVNPPDPPAPSHTLIPNPPTPSRTLIPSPPTMRGDEEIEKGLRSLGISLDPEKLMALKRVGKSEVLTSLIEAGQYFDQAKGVKAQGQTPRTAPSGAGALDPPAATSGRGG